LKTRFSVPEYSVLQCARCGADLKSVVVEKSKEEIEARIREADFHWQSPNRQPGADYDLRDKKARVYGRHLRILAELLPQQGSLLDVGCATGVFLDMARREGWQATGLEISSRSAQYARDHFGLEVVTGTLEEESWSSRSFDAITMWDVIEHMADPRTAVAQAGRLLKEGGMLVVSTPNGGSLLHRSAVLMFRLSNGLVQLPLRSVYGTGDGGHILFLNQEALTHLLNRHGFEVSRVCRNAVSQGLWRPMTLFERFLGVVDTTVGALLNARYRIIVYARKVSYPGDGGMRQTTTTDSVCGKEGA
jgi:2-polyprenyl-3-methyl-5-hydroxy-6-metoxy-1,4-benzoquinol methylase